MKRIVSRMMWLVACAAPLVALGGGGETQEVIIAMQQDTEGYSMGNLSGEVVVDWVNPGKFGVKNRAFEVRSVIEFSLEHLCTLNSASDVASATLQLVVGNSDPDDEVIGFIDFYAYEGDGEVTADDWDEGAWFGELSEDGWSVPVSLDATEVVKEAIANGWSTLGLRMSTQQTDRYFVGKAMGISVPNPFFVVQLSGPTDATNYESFGECFMGPNITPDPTCLASFDYDCDSDVDLADFAEFTRRFEGI